tara:strand:- start:338 stop:718 length:381 start_codon:yes stop_codon:yes gene_type:complete
VFKEYTVAAIIDHIAIVVDDLEEAAEWYIGNCGGEVTHKEDTYYRLQLENTCLALVLSSHGPNKPHVGILVECLEDMPDHLGQVVKHRDGTHGVYATDPWNNHIEYICYNTKDCKEKFLSYRKPSS